MPSLAARVAMISGSHERHDMENLIGAPPPRYAKASVEIVAMHPMPMMTDATTKVMVRRDMTDLLSGDQNERGGSTTLSVTDGCRQDIMPLIKIAHS
jgi:hypothetical protein